MKLLHKFCIRVSLWMGILLVLQFPIIKVGTTKALTFIEGHYLRPDMTDADKTQYELFKGWILGNERATASRLAAARYLGLGACLALLIQSLVGLRHERSRRTAEPSAAPNGGPAIPLGNSAVSEGPPPVS